MSWSHWSLHIHNKDDLPSIHPRGLFYANWISIYTPLQMPTRWKLRHPKEGLIHHSYTEWDGTPDPATHWYDSFIWKWLSVQNSSASRFAHKTGAQWTCDWWNFRYDYHHSYYHWLNDLNDWWKASPNAGILSFWHPNFEPWHAIIHRSTTSLENIQKISQ